MGNRFDHSPNILNEKLAAGICQGSGLKACCIAPSADSDDDFGSARKVGAYIVDGGKKGPGAVIIVANFVEDGAMHESE